MLGSTGVKEPNAVEKPVETGAVQVITALACMLNKHIAIVLSNNSNLAFIV
jgi:hypothetical protein